MSRPVSAWTPWKRRYGHDFPRFGSASAVLHQPDGKCFQTCLELIDRQQIVFDDLTLAMAVSCVGACVPPRCFHNTRVQEDGRDLRRVSLAGSFPHQRWVIGFS
jgi:hypothetical protein